MDGQAQLDSFIDKYTPEVAALTRALFEKMKARVPGATIMVYDNYNALAIGLGPSERASEAVLSLAVMPRWVLLYFLDGTKLADPNGLLQGQGTKGRHIRVTDAAQLDDPAVDALSGAALDRLEPPIDETREHQLIIKSISAKQRPRRPKD
jgi:hypothetical protein